LDLKIPVVNPTKCLGRIASRCNLSEKVKRTALMILRKAEEIGITEGKDPMG
jgi:transcription initiation factor TFIIB